MALTNWLAKLAAVRAGTDYAKILCVGDSTTWGYDGLGTPPLTGAYPARLCALIAADGTPATIGLNTCNTGAEDDARWSMASWAHFTSGGFVSSRYGNSGSGTLAFSPGYECNTADVYYITNSGLGSCSVSVDGGSATVINSSGVTGGIGKTTITFAPGSSHVISFAPVSGDFFFLCGIDCYDSTTKSVRIALSGANSSSTSNWSGSGEGFGSINAIRVYAPDLTIFKLGINDAGFDVSVADWTTRTQAIAAAAQESGDFLLVSVTASQNSGIFMREQEYATAAAGLGYDFIDALNLHYVDWATANAQGWMYDGFHDSGAGHQAFAEYLFPSVAPAPAPSGNGSAMSVSLGLHLGL